MKSYKNKNCSLYLECNSGISGDMTVAALLDLGADQDVLKNVLDSLNLQGFQTQVSRVKKSGIDCCDFAVLLDAEHENHDHDMEYLHGSCSEHHERSEHTHDHAHHHHEGEHGEHHHHHGDEHGEHHHHHEGEHGEHHHHHHGDEHGEHHHHHEHRGLPEIMEILERGQMTEGARTLAKRIFQILGEAEAKAHGLPIEQVHFHEVGAVDSIVDIVSVAVCLDNLQVEQVIVPKICEGRGTVRCQHGVLPIPVPATANIMEAYDLNVEFMDVQGEFVTPTGAAIAAAIMTADTLPELYKVHRIGYGAGKRTYERPSILRAMLLEEKQTNQNNDTIFKLESNIDDCSGETLGYVMDRLFEAGARDVHYTPVFMKKNRPGWQLNIICKEEDIQRLEDIIFMETTTIGVRRVRMERTILEREMRTVETSFGAVQVKVCKRGETEYFYPEYDSVAAIAREQSVPYMEVYRQAVHASIDK